jgi:hypothetical protein
MIIQAPKIKNAMFIKTTSVPPKYLPSNNCVRDTGFDNNKSMLPFSNIIGIKLADENIASSRHKFDNGAVIINCIFVIICSRIISLPDGPMLDKIDSVFTKLKTTASPIKKITDIAAKKIKTFRAKASRKVYQVIVTMFFIYDFPYRPG